MGFSPLSASMGGLVSAEAEQPVPSTVPMANAARKKNRFMM
jgi:hypothetical protein